jgi:hypothetical protein
MQQDPSRYRAYMLRLWRVEDGAETPWRASLQNVRTGQRLGFAGLDEAIAHLREEVLLAPDANASGEG